ncbi:MAG: hypothetical protein LC098_10550 [Burkholderiales bacterium]|uniref:hypothetical protein n=1 Tax=Dokdonella sp. TaxID=2291710 RepID=UPI0027B921CC|nr:hypothetical protein [Dokdonella sp.]MCZ2135848.1 hypothetical protein [Burkholderiales bacterium]
MANQVTDRRRTEEDRWWEAGGFATLAEYEQACARARSRLADLLGIAGEDVPLDAACYMASGCLPEDTPVELVRQFWSERWWAEQEVRKAPCSTPFVIS